MSKKLVHTPEGVRDIYGEEKAKKTVVERLLQEKITGYGYRDIQTPTFEFIDVFSKEVGTTPSIKYFAAHLAMDGVKSGRRTSVLPSLSKNL